LSRVVVVGASSGLGRCVAVGLGRRGDRVALLARRIDLLESAAAEAGADSFPLRCDVTDDGSCADAIGRAADRLGGIDAVVYCTGLGVLAPIEQLSREQWDRSFTTNVVGASAVTTAALPHLRRSKGMAAYFTSVSASLTTPWPGLAAYTVTKAALDKLVEAWRSEHPDVGFTRIIVGECAGGDGHAATQLADGWDATLAGEYFGTWYERGLLTEQLMEADHLVDVVQGLLRCGASATIPTVAVTPRRPL
jgi:NAD(P)-dependent dehydrogenase (short-subunit alcohol dehydrogenase family)